MTPETLYSKFSQIGKDLEKQSQKLGAIARRFIKATPEEPALSPGTLTYVGEKREEKVTLTVIDYDEHRHEQKEVDSPEACFGYRDSPSVSWINVKGVHDVEMIEKLGKHFGIHALVLEDIVHTHQRPKLENHNNYLYIVLRMLRFDAKKDEIQSSQVSLILARNWLLSFQETNEDVFNPVRERAKNIHGRIRKFRTDYLTYALIDAIVDSYFEVLEKMGEKIEQIEEEINRRPSPETIRQIHVFKREMLFMRKSIWPLREVINQLYKEEVSLIQETTRIYLRDVYDHTIQIIETVESFRDMLSGMLDLYLSVMSNRMNEVMKVLTVIATIFIPPTFVVGIYGMNFENMPELQTHYGYFVVLGALAIVMSGMLLIFRRKKWL
ncbi:MAG TPA: magnesium/cobalt transporter CorA [bacterium]|nr:magnesium/cobalt transporter CorA [bacterium]